MPRSFATCAIGRPVVRTSRTARSRSSSGYLRGAGTALQGLHEAGGSSVGRAVAARVERQSVLYEPGRESVFVLTEAVLRTWPGTPALMLAQLDRLLAVESLSTVRLGVISWRLHWVLSS
ncbi:Scr1 family TA system antitoxin-like transcriptional regulator [Streptomyces sp. enrichment culture]|uniref:Scr1 family TA system antitoxin-like transcriptional regulator n=1 Tax=Streptomyces sp. enrichment culture TaxID=1795815 RepID=UPI003F56DE92